MLCCTVGLAYFCASQPSGLVHSDPHSLAPTCLYLPGGLGQQKAQSFSCFFASICSKLEEEGGERTDGHP